MERYTEKHYDGNGYYLICSGNCETFNCGDCGILDKIVDRLAAYEDTGLEPEDFKRTFTEDALLKLTGQLLGVTPDRLRELAQADQEGKIPKYTIGDTIYDRFGDAWEVTAVERHLLAGEPKWIYRCGHIGTNDYCALWEFEVLTRADAEAALRREQDG